MLRQGEKAKAGMLMPVFRVAVRGNRASSSAIEAIYVTVQ
jgi:hypothetical protein